LPAGHAGVGLGLGSAHRLEGTHRLGEDRMAEQPNNERYWARTQRLMWTMLVIWAFFSFVIHFFAPQLNAIKIAGFPLGFYMAAQGSLIVFVAMLFWFAAAQDKIDREEGVAEEE
jgi:putative solute:sodium symporter small subunit